MVQSHPRAPYLRMWISGEITCLSNRSRWVQFPSCAPITSVMVWWRSGHAVDCKSTHGGSIPSQTSKLYWVRSSGVERLVDIQVVGGSTPSAPTKSCSHRLSARIADFQSAGTGSTPVGSTNYCGLHRLHSVPCTCRGVCHRTARAFTADMMLGYSGE